MSDQVTVRELRREDIGNGFLDTLDSLRRDSSKTSSEKADAIFDKIDSNPDCIIAVAVSDGVVVGAATLLVESKFIHDGGIAGHIEDVVVRADLQGNDIGKKIMEHLLSVAKSRGCYKVVLDCTDEVKPFYEKLGFRLGGNQMRLDYDGDDDDESNSNGNSSVNSNSSNK